MAQNRTCLRLRRYEKDEDNRVNKYQAMDDKCGSAMAKIAAATSFFTPELLEAPSEKIEKFIDEEPGLKQYRFLLESTLRRNTSFPPKKTFWPRCPKSPAPPATFSNAQQRRPHFRR
ncbi:MAG: hypothetical protein ACLTK0_07335 [Anaerovoracaceae bacterium]